MNKRIIVESIIVSISLIIIGIGWRILQGFIMTKNYTPEISNTYNLVTVSDSKTTFGIQSENGLLLLIIMFVLITTMYYGMRILLKRLVKKKV